MLEGTTERRIKLTRQLNVFNALPGLIKPFIDIIKTLVTKREVIEPRDKITYVAAALEVQTLDLTTAGSVMYALLKETTTASS